MTSADDIAADSASVLACEDARCMALASVDISTLDRLFSDDLIHVHSNGMVHSKAELLAHIATRRAFIAVERDALKVRLYSEIAVLTGDLVNHMRGPDGQTIRMDGFATQVLRREGGEWRFVNFQLTLK